MNRIDRLFALLLLLQNKQIIRAIDLAQRFGITERTVYRDMSALMQMGVPIVSLPGQGYQMIEGFYLPPIIFTTEEATALFLGVAMLSASGNFIEAARKSKEKLIIALPEHSLIEAQNLSEMIEFMLPKAAFNLNTPYLVELRKAILRKQVIRIRYHSRTTDTLAEREVDPYGIVASSSAWYFHGYCHLRQAIRSFRLDRVESLVVLKENFLVQSVTSPLASPQHHIIHIKVDPTHIRWVHERQHYGFVSEEPALDGVVMTYHVETFLEIQSWIMSWGASVDVLEPHTLREIIFKEAEVILQRRFSIPTS